MTEALRDIIDGHHMPCVASIVEATARWPNADGGRRRRRRRSGGRGGRRRAAAAAVGPDRRRRVGGGGDVREKLVETVALHCAVVPAADHTSRGHIRAAPPTADEMVVPVAALEKSLAAAPTMLEGAMTAKEGHADPRGGAGRGEHARQKRARGGACCRGSLHLLDDRPADHRVFRRRRRVHVGRVGGAAPPLRPRRCVADPAAAPRAASGGLRRPPPASPSPASRSAAECPSPRRRGKAEKHYLDPMIRCATRY